MNIYCKCGKELEIEKDMNTEIHVFSHVCSAAMQARIEKLEKLLSRIDVAFRTDTTQAEGNDYFWTVRQQLTDALKEAK